VTTPLAGDPENFGVDMRDLTDKMRWIPKGAFGMGSDAVDTSTGHISFRCIVRP
jgi:hypothetical protein